MFYKYKYNTIGYYSQELGAKKRGRFRKILPITFRKIKINILTESTTINITNHINYSTGSTNKLSSDNTIGAFGDTTFVEQAAYAVL